MLILIFLDDERNFKDVTWVNYPKFDKTITVRNNDEFVAALMDCSHKMQRVWISFDHDIQSEGEIHVELYGEQLHIVREITGLDCCMMAIERGCDPHQMFVHSRNPVGASNIQQAIAAAKEGRK